MDGLLRQLASVVEAILAASEGTPDEARALFGIAQIRQAADRVQPDLVAVGGWAASYRGGTLHATRGLLVLRVDPTITLGEEDVQELRTLIDQEHDLAVGEVELWLASNPTILRHLYDDGMRVEHVAALIVAALRE